MGQYYLEREREREGERETGGFVLGDWMIGIFFFWSQLPNISFLIKLF